MPPIDVKDAKDTPAPPTNQQDAVTKEASKLPPVVTSQVCSVVPLVPLVTLVTIATGRATLITGCHIK